MRSLNGCGDYTPAAFDCHQGCLSRENEERTRERLISSGINTIQPRVHIDFTQSRLVVIAAVFVSRIMKGRPTTGPNVPVAGSVAKELWMLRTPIPSFTTLD